MQHWRTGEAPLIHVALHWHIPKESNTPQHPNREDLLCSKCHDFSANSSSRWHVPQHSGEVSGLMRWEEEGEKAYTYIYTHTQTHGRARQKYEWARTNTEWVGWAVDMKSGLTVKPMPTVEVKDPAMNLPWSNWTSREVLPTPLSPTRMVCRQIYRETEATSCRLQRCSFYLSPEALRCVGTGGVGQCVCS